MKLFCDVIEALCNEFASWGLLRNVWRSSLWMLKRLRGNLDDAFWHMMRIFCNFPLHNMFERIRLKISRRIWIADCYSNDKKWHLIKSTKSTKPLIGAFRLKSEISSCNPDKSHLGATEESTLFSSEYKCWDRKWNLETHLSGRCTKKIISCAIDGKPCNFSAENLRAYTDNAIGVMLFSALKSNSFVKWRIKLTIENLSCRSVIFTPPPSVWWKRNTAELSV